MTKISNCLASKVKVDGIEEDVLKYVFFVLLSQTYYLAICLVLGGIFGHIISAVMYFFMFNILRRYAGGMHATKEYKCIAISTGLILLSIASINVLIRIAWKDFVIPVGIAFVLVGVLSPIQSKEKPLSANRRKINKIKAVFVAGIGFLAVLFIRMSEARYSIGIAIIDEALLLILGKMRIGKF